MTKEEFFELADKYSQDRATEKERQIIDDFCTKLQISSISDQWNLSQKEETRLRLIQNITQSIDRLEIEKTQRLHKRKLKSWQLAASVILLIGLSWMVWPQSQELLDEKQFLTKSSQRGQKVTVTLSDGTTVRLNAESSITYPKTFGEENRHVELNGEAFFEVTKNPAKPFVVASNGLRTTVLGTSFNINAYPENKNVSVTVATGKVQVTAVDQINRTEGQETLFLEPGQQGSLDKKSSTITKNEIRLDKYLAWKEGIIYLDHTTLKEATEILGRWYDISFIFKNNQVEHCLIDGEFKNDQLSNILENIQFLTGIEYEFVQKNQVVLSGIGCK